MDNRFNYTRVEGDNRFGLPPSGVDRGSLTVMEAWSRDDPNTAQYFMGTSPERTINLKCTENTFGWWGAKGVKWNPLLEGVHEAAICLV
jgi:hypothetical protein